MAESVGREVMKRLGLNCSCMPEPVIKILTESVEERILRIKELREQLRKEGKLFEPFLLPIASWKDAEAQRWKRKPITASERASSLLESRQKFYREDQPLGIDFVKLLDIHEILLDELRNMPECK